VRRGDRVFQDEVVWDVGNPLNTADAYVRHTCADLGLGHEWYEAIRTHLQQQLADVRQVRRCPGVCRAACVLQGHVGGLLWCADGSCLLRCMPGRW
jgi:hypothetical protein